ncbi:hypothetical protein [Streptomyces sp. NRRL F-5123]|uniref:hypothetical protein n=1 Tax=Streptomyces sp. NRRL F-5123 TaxID=1463856 RepID=UPI000B30D016|nr:hypothetical protein [Streptomyces sp. NRRL F-5123]
MDIPETVAAAQRAVNAAWQAVEDHRKTVQAARDADPRVELKPGVLVVRPWAADEESTYARLHQAAVEAAEERARVMRESGIVSTYDNEVAIRTAARDAPEV